MRWRLLWDLLAGPAVLLVVATAISGALLLGQLDTDGSYTCAGNALSTIINPEPDNPSIRAVAFDDAAACNHSARIRGVVALIIFGAATTLSGAWAVVRRRSGMYG